MKKAEVTRYFKYLGSVFKEKTLRKIMAEMKPGTPGHLDLLFILNNKPLETKVRRLPGKKKAEVRQVLADMSPEERAKWRAKSRRKRAFKHGKREWVSRTYTPGEITTYETRKPRVPVPTAQRDPVTLNHKDLYGDPGFDINTDGFGSTELPPSFQIT